MPQIELTFYEINQCLLFISQPLQLRFRSGALTELVCLQSICAYMAEWRDTTFPWWCKAQVDLKPNGQKHRVSSGVLVTCTGADDDNILTPLT